LIGWWVSNLDRAVGEAEYVHSPRILHYTHHLSHPSTIAKLEVSIEHITYVNVYGIECYNYHYSSYADSATPRD